MGYLSNDGMKRFWQKMKDYTTDHTSGMDTSKLYYKTGDSFELGWMQTAGTLTGAQKQLYFTIPLCKPVLNINGLKISDLKLTVRQNNKYLIGSGSASAAPSGTTELTLQDNQIKVLVTLSTALSGVNNDPVSVFADGTITFT